MKEVKSKGIAPMQGIYAKLKRMVPFCLYFLCTRGRNLFKYHFNKFRVTCTGVYCVVRRIPSINPYHRHLENPHSFFNHKSSCVSCQPMIKPILLNLNKLRGQTSSAIMTAVTNLETWKLRPRPHYACRTNLKTQLWERKRNKCSASTLERFRWLFAFKISKYHILRHVDYLGR